MSLTQFLKLSSEVFEVDASLGGACAEVAKESLIVLSKTMLLFQQ